MVLAVTLLTFASIFAWNAAPAMAIWLLFENAGSHHWMTDYNFSSVQEVGNPIVGSRLDYGFPTSQSWRLDPTGTHLYRFVTSRQEGTTTPVEVAAHADALQGGNLKAEPVGYGTFFQPVQQGPDSELWAFVTPYTSPPLAITAPPAENRSLYLEPYDKTRRFQHWLAYGRPNASVAGRPAGPQDLRPATPAEVLAAAKEN